MSLIEKSQLNEIRKEETVNAIKIAISAEPMESDLNEVEDFSFIGLHKEIAVYFDLARFIPLRVNGIIPAVGKVELNLCEARLKN